MVLKGKRRAGQRSAVRQGDCGQVRNGGAPSNASPRSPPGNKKRKVHGSVDTGEDGAAESLNPRTSARRQPPPVNGARRGSPRHHSRGQARSGRKVLTPPRPRRSPGSSRGAGINRDQVLPSDEEERIVGKKTAKPIPETSDDRDVYEIQRLPLDDNPFYKRFEAFQSAGPSSGAVCDAAISPVTPVTRRPLEFGAGLGVRPEPSIINVENMGCDNAEREEASPIGVSVPSLDGDLHGFRVTRDMLSSFYKEVRDMVKKEMSSLQSIISTRFDSMEAVQAKAVAELSEMRVVVSASRGGACTQSRLTPLGKYEAKLDSNTPHAELVFDMGSICKILRINLPCTVVAICAGQGNFVDNVSVAVRAILFGLLPSQKRAVFSTGVGRRHSAFRFSVVMNILCNVQRNRFRCFLDDAPAETMNAQQQGNLYGALEAPAQGVGAGSEAMRIRQPEWLRPCYIRQKHVVEARGRVESNAGSLDSSAGFDAPAGARHRKAWITVKETPDRGDIAKYGALKVYRFVTTGLYYGREKARWLLFEELTYIMTVWSHDEGDIDQRCMRVSWGNSGSDLQRVDMSEVPVCMNRSTDPSNADEHNMNLLAEFLSARKEMVLCVCHQVKIRPGGTSVRNRRDVETRILRRSINLVDVALKFCVVFTEQSIGGFSSLPFLGAHQDSLKCVYALSVLFRRVVETFMDEYILDGSFVMPDGEDPPQVECHGIKLDNLLPAASVRKRLLTTRCLRMTTDEYDKINAGCSGAEGYNASDEEGEEDEIGIQPDAVEGVVLI